jgi:uncharacterized protein with PQ loop repeat
MTDVVLFYIGLCANIINLAYNVPLVYKPLKTRSVDNISFYFMSMRLVGTSLWIAYGFVDGDVFIVVTNAVTLSSTLCLIAFFIFQRYGIFGFVSGQDYVLPTTTAATAKNQTNPNE